MGRSLARLWIGQEPPRGEIERHGAEALAAATEVATDALTARYGSGPIAGRIRAHVLTARR